jgi:hypothetical protein
MNLINHILLRGLDLLPKLPDLWISKLLLLLFAFFGAVGGAVVIWEGARRILFHKRLWLKKIAQLAPGTTLSFFNSLLGSAVFVRTNKETKSHIFINRFFYIEAVTDLADTIQMFSVTTRSRRFNPKLKLGPYSADNKYVVVRLGKTKFNEVDGLGHQGTVRSGMGARRISYAEEYYFGNPGLYQHYALSANDAGYVVYDSNLSYGILNEHIENTSDRRLESFRAAMVVNTYTIIAPFVDTVTLGKYGADYDQVRVLQR